jgi:hypothetical protein
MYMIIDYVTSYKLVKREILPTSEGGIALQDTTTRMVPGYPHSDDTTYDMIN